MEVLAVGGALITIIGTIASIYSAIIAKKQASEAISAAEAAKQVQKNISHHRKTSDVTRLKESTERLISNMKVYGPGANEDMLDGIDHSSNSVQLQDFTIKLDEHISTFTGKEKKEVTDLNSELKNLLQEFNKAGVSLEERKEKGSDILGKLSYLNSILKTRLNLNVEKES